MVAVLKHGPVIEAKWIYITAAIYPEPRLGTLCERFLGLEQDG